MDQATSAGVPAQGATGDGGPPDPRHPALHRLADRVGRAEALDRPAHALLGATSRAIRPGPLRDVLSGTFLGHPLHPLLTDLPIGTWVSAMILDATGGDRARPAARRLIGVGILASTAAATTGAVEWTDSAKTRPATRRVGLAHASANVAALSLYGASYLARRRGRGGRGLAAAGAAALVVGGHLGGHLAYVHGEGVAATTFEQGPDEWTPTIAADELRDGEPTRVQAGGVDVLLVRLDGALHALADRCTHRGGPLHQGTLEDGCVTCPWHGSRFSLADGDVRRGPAASPQPAYEARVSDGRIEVRQATDPTP